MFVSGLHKKFIYNIDDENGRIICSCVLRFQTELNFSKLCGVYTYTHTYSIHRILDCAKDFNLISVHRWDLLNTCILLNFEFCSWKNGVHRIYIVLLYSFILCVLWCECIINNFVYRNGKMILIKCCIL